MRAREEIEDDCKNSTEDNECLELEVLLDIRDLLIQLREEQTSAFRIRHSKNDVLFPSDELR
jgi:hypothetical protein